ncbi:MAG: hypothetical protein JXQ72_05045 [Anaerolineae bacterium]|nr:hypothetical protein [Anaerolineae bacterium]
MSFREPVSVRKVTTRADFKIFLRFPWYLYKDDPNWVPPLVSSQRAKIDPRKNPTWRHLEGAYFIAWRGDQPVGTIAAFINHRHNAFHEERIGFFGLFEVYNDQEAANALLATAANTVRARGASALRGPATFSTNDEVGMLVEGFDSAPVMVMAYNPPYYARLLDRAPGFDPIMSLYSYRLTLEEWEASSKLRQLLRVTRRNNERHGITVRTFSRRHLRRDLNILKDIYNHSWDNNWGFVPLSEAELGEMVSAIRGCLRPELALIAEVNGETAGFLLAFPDLNQALQRANPHPGKPDVVSRMQMLWHWRLRSKIDRVRIPLMGIRSDFRGIGVEAALFVQMYQDAIRLSQRTGWRYADAGWVLEANAPMQRLVEAYSGPPYKRYLLYERRLEPAAVDLWPDPSSPSVRRRHPLSMRRIPQTSRATITRTLRAAARRVSVLRDSS